MVQLKISISSLPNELKTSKCKNTVLYKHSVHPRTYLNKFQMETHKHCFYKEINSDQKLYRQACMCVRMDRWMDALIEVRNVVCIMTECVYRYVCVCVCGLCNVFMYIWNFVWVYIFEMYSDICMFIMSIWLCMFLNTHVCVCVSLCVCAFWVSLARYTQTNLVYC